MLVSCTIRCVDLSVPCSFTSGSLNRYPVGRGGAGQWCVHGLGTLPIMRVSQTERAAVFLLPILCWRLIVAHSRGTNSQPISAERQFSMYWHDTSRCISICFVYTLVKDSPINVFTVPTAFHYELDGPGFESRYEQDIFLDFNLLPCSECCME
jgi:hypothetical protein